jgi:hypothetical protein
MQMPIFREIGTRCLEDPASANSRTGYVILFANCPIIWASRLQTEHSQSTTEAEYISLATALREVINLMYLVTELRDRKFLTHSLVPRVYCKAFEDNSGALELARLPKMRPRTKWLNAKFHFFRKYVERKVISIFSIETREQLADIFTKNIPLDLFLKFRWAICGW